MADQGGGSPSPEDDRKKRVEQLKARMEGLKRGITLSESESTPPSAVALQGGARSVIVRREGGLSDSSSSPNLFRAAAEQDPGLSKDPGTHATSPAQGNDNDKKGEVAAAASPIAGAAGAAMVAPFTSQSMRLPSPSGGGKLVPVIKKPISPCPDPSSNPGSPRTPKPGTPREHDKARENYSLEPTQDLLSRLIEIQALLTSYSVEFVAEDSSQMPIAMDGVDTSNPDVNSMVSIWKPKYDEVLELLASSIEFFRDHEVVSLKEAAEKEKAALSSSSSSSKEKITKKEVPKPAPAPKVVKTKIPPSSPSMEVSIKRKDEAPKAPRALPVPPSSRRRPSVVLTQRSRIEMEIFDTEATFVGQLRALIENYLLPLRASRLDVPAEKLLTIFMNVEIIYQYNTRLLEQLEKVIIEEDTSSSIGKIFLEMAPFLKVYSDYIAGSESATACFGQCMKAANFSSFINEQYNKLNSNTDAVALDVPSLLIAPVQRIPRYVLLLQELLKYTPSVHADYANIQQALLKIREVADHLNNSQKQSNALKKILEIQTSIEGDYLNLVEPHRVFAKEGVLMAMWDKPETTELSEGWGPGATGSEYMFFLFNDLLLYASPRKKFGALPKRGGKGIYDYKGFFLLFNGNVVDVPESKDQPNTLELIYKEDPLISPSASQRYLLRARNGTEKKEWMEQLNVQIAAARSAISASKNDLFKPTSKQGYLYKRGENRKNWKRRYFRMKGDSLFYYENAKETRPIGVVFLPDYSLHMAEERMKKPFCFELRHPEKRCYFFQADCSDAVSEWATAFYNPIAWIDSDIANKYLDRDVVKNNREEKILASETSERLTRRPAAVFANFHQVRKFSSFRSPAEIMRGIASAAPTDIPTTRIPQPNGSSTAAASSLSSPSLPSSPAQPSPLGAHTQTAQPTLRVGMRLGLIGRERGVVLDKPAPKENA